MKPVYAIGPGVGVIYWKNDTPAVHGDRILLLQGQVILIATYPLLDAAVYVGNPDNPTASAFFRTSDAGGTIRNVAGPYLVLPDTRKWNIIQPSIEFSSAKSFIILCSFTTMKKSFPKRTIS